MRAPKIFLAGDEKLLGKRVKVFKDDEEISSVCYQVALDGSFAMCYVRDENGYLVAEGDQLKKIKIKNVKVIMEDI